MSAPSRPSDLLQQLTREFRAWADNRQPSAGSAASVTPLAAIEPGSTGDSPPAHWPLRSGSPPAHWVELVRAKAPGLLDGTLRGAIRTRTTPPSAVPPGPLHVANPEPTPAPPELTVTEIPASDARPVPEAGGNTAPTDQPDPSLTFSASEVPPAQPPNYPTGPKRRSQPLLVFTSAENAPPSAPPIETPAASLAALPVYEPPGAAIPTMPLQATRAEAVPPAELNVSRAEAASAGEWRAPEPPTVPVVTFPRYGELSPLIQTTTFPPTAGEPAQRTTSFPPPAASESVAERAAYSEMLAPGRSVIQWETLEGYWPELPHLDEPPEADESSLLRAWTRQERLDREQRGIGWSERLS
ncbi:MAG: hypothetical protein HZC41_08035 [Chloroflexi bacterium]|nr:hypothetical protein [Chloroflexota bacterium]